MHHVAGIAPLVTPEPDCGDHEEQREGGDQDEGGHEAKEEAPVRVPALLTPTA
jgi:hypothetical protein